LDFDTPKDAPVPGTATLWGDGGAHRSGTLLLRSKVKFAQARGTAVPDAQPVGTIPAGG